MFLIIKSTRIMEFSGDVHWFVVVRSCRKLLHLSACSKKHRVSWENCVQNHKKKSPTKKRMFPSLELIVSPGFVIWSLSQSDEAIKFCWRLQKKLSAILQSLVRLIEFPSVDSNSFGRFLALGKVLPFFQKGTAAERCLDIATLSSLGPYQKSCIIWFDFAYRVTVRLFPLFFWTMMMTLVIIV